MSLLSARWARHPQLRTLHFPAGTPPRSLFSTSSLSDLQISYIGGTQLKFEGTNLLRPDRVISSSSHGLDPLQEWDSLVYPAAEFTSWSDLRDLAIRNTRLVKSRTIQADSSYFINEHPSISPQKPPEAPAMPQYLRNKTKLIHQVVSDLSRIVTLCSLADVWKDNSVLKNDFGSDALLLAHGKAVMTDFKLDETVPETLSQRVGVAGQLRDTESPQNVSRFRSIAFPVQPLTRAQLIQIISESPLLRMSYMTSSTDPPEDSSAEWSLMNPQVYQSQLLATAGRSRMQLSAAEQSQLLSNFHYPDPASQTEATKESSKKPPPTPRRAQKGNSRPDGGRVSQDYLRTAAALEALEAAREASQASLTSSLIGPPMHAVAVYRALPFETLLTLYADMLQASEVDPEAVGHALQESASADMTREEALQQLRQVIGADYGARLQNALRSDWGDELQSIPPRKADADLQPDLGRQGGREASPASVRTAPPLQHFPKLYTGWSGFDQNTPHGNLQEGAALPSATALNWGSVGGVLHPEEADGGFWVLQHIELAPSNRFVDVEKEETEAPKLTQQRSTGSKGRRRSSPVSAPPSSTQDKRKFRFPSSVLLWPPTLKADDPLAEGVRPPKGLVDGSYSLHSQQRVVDDDEFAAQLLDPTPDPEPDPLQVVTQNFDSGKDSRDVDWFGAEDDLESLLTDPIAQNQDLLKEEEEDPRVAEFEAFYNSLQQAPVPSHMQRKKHSGGRGRRRRR